MAKPGVLIPLLMVGLTCVSALAGDFYEVCAKPAVIGRFAGPHLVAKKGKDTKDIDEAISLIFAGETDDAARKAKAKSLRESVEQNGGLFASSPYTLKNFSGEEKIDKLCVVFAAGGVAWIISEKIQNNPNNPSALSVVLDVADGKCFDFVRTIKRDK